MNIDMLTRMVLNLKRQIENHGRRITAVQNTETVPGSGTPATSVVAATSFGASPAVGTHANYARQDHSHGTPANPVTAHESGYDHHLLHSNANDPAAGEKAALAGTTGTPGAANKFVTNDDARNTNARIPTSHSHTTGDVTNLQTILDGKAASSHTHAIADVTNLQTTLSGKSDTGHTHSGLVTTCKQSAQITNSSNVNLSDITGMAFSLVSGRRYYFRFLVTFQTAATTTGIGFAFSGPAMTAANWRVEIRQAAAGTDQMFQNSDTALTTVLVSASVVALGTNYIAVIEGFCQPSANGTLQLRCRSEVNASQVTVQNTGIGFLVDAG